MSSLAAGVKQAPIAFLGTQAQLEEFRAGLIPEEAAALKAKKAAEKAAADKASLRQMRAEQDKIQRRFYDQFKSALNDLDQSKMDDLLETHLKPIRGPKQPTYLSDLGATLFCVDSINKPFDAMIETIMEETLPPLSETQLIYQMDYSGPIPVKKPESSLRELEFRRHQFKRIEMLAAVAERQNVGSHITRAFRAIAAFQLIRYAEGMMAYHYALANPKSEPVKGNELTTGNEVSSPSFKIYFEIKKNYTLIGAKLLKELCDFRPEQVWQQSYSALVKSRIDLYEEMNVGSGKKSFLIEVLTDLRDRMNAHVIAEKAKAAAEASTVRTLVEAGAIRA